MRRPLTVIATLLFYAAPVAAGAGGAPYWSIGVFAALGAVWLGVSRPGRPAGALLLAFPVVALGAAVLLAAGITVHDVLDLPVLPVLPFAVLSLLAIVLMRAARRGDARIAPVDREIAAHVDGVIVRAEAEGRQPSEPVLRALARLDSLPEVAPRLGHVEDALTPLLLDPGEAPAGMDRLLARHDSTRAPRDRLAVVLLATHPVAVPRLAGRGDVPRAFETVVGAADAPLLWQFADCSDALLDVLPDAAAGMPRPARLDDIAGQIAARHPEEAEALTRLARRLETLGETA
ncbi:hypothetical protein RM543_00375 [Roseicyclus sp. F158]|uniref:Uncharacterized protein n=1 Tax=Tropicimonas omnivorans TaxID=3075590 RepID=A0ABU3DBP0_9RHOB|nr:hypothetical protein [Roseicyclus sp. F158]MDT0681122.1 hypothetical protein [Roseicyclus sp. F158]